MRRDKRGRPVCWCGGYHFPHRRGGGACEHSRTCNVHRAFRTKDPEVILDALIEHALAHPGRPYEGPPPF